MHSCQCVDTSMPLQIKLRLPADGSGWAEMCSHWLIQLRHPLISLFFSAVNRSEGGWSGSTEAGRVRGVPRSRELVVNFREERRWSLLRGLTAPRQKPLIQTAVRGLLWWRPLQTQLFNRFWEDTEKFGIHPGFGGAGRRQTWGGGVSHWARQLLSIWSYRWHAVISQLIVTSGQWAGVSSLSTGRWEPLPRCFFLTGPCEEENGRARGAGSLSEKKALRMRREARLMLSQ